MIWAALPGPETGAWSQVTRLLDRVSGDVLMAVWIEDQAGMLQSGHYLPGHFMAKTQRGGDCRWREVVNISPIESASCLEKNTCKQLGGRSKTLNAMPE